MLTELMLEKYRDVYLDYFHKDKEKFKASRVVHAVAFAMFYSLVVFIVGKSGYFYGIPIAAFIGYKFPYFSLLLNKRKTDLLISFVFPEFLQSFMALLGSSGNVYQTLKGTIKYTSEPLKGQVEKLVSKIEQGNDRDDYIAFAEFVNSSEAYMIMDMVYQFSEVGVSDEALGELQRYIDNIKENKVDELIARKLNRTDTLGIVPIIFTLFMILGFIGVMFWHYLSPILGEGLL